jgi:pimeloyl-ACP methyl ester carboxylesterase/DNA-binding winged helix-turn-helix (wHTH) protein
MSYRFGRFELVEETRELLADGKPCPVEPQVFDLLAYLVSERDRVISTDDLIASVWNGRIVSNSAVSARISAARSALGDDGVRQQWIKTVPRRGFRFVGTVEADALQEARHPARSEEAQQQRVAFCRSADGTQIAYATSGEGCPLVKVGHWLTHLEHDWHSPIWAPQLERLSGSFRFLRFDQRGNGLSDWQVADFTLDRFVEDLEAVVDAAGLDRFALYGTSQGAPVAVAYAARHPDRVSHLVLQGGYVRGRLVREAPDDREQGEALLTLIRHGWGKPDSALADIFATMLVPDGNEKQVRSLADLQRQSTSPENAARIRAGVDAFDISAAAKAVRAPTLVIHARGDNVQPLDQGRELATAIPGAEFLMLNSRNHIILPQEPAWEALYDAIDRFIGRT